MYKLPSLALSEKTRCFEVMINCTKKPFGTVATAYFTAVTKTDILYEKRGSKAVILNQSFSRYLHFS